MPEAHGKHSGSKTAAAGEAGLDERRFSLISKALADPTRMAVLRKVAEGSIRCGEVRDCLGVSAATLSHHLKELEHAGIVTLTRQGRFVNATFERKAWKHYVAALKSLMH